MIKFTSFHAKAIFHVMQIPLCLIAFRLDERVLVPLVRRERGKHHGRILITWTRWRNNSQ